MNKKDPCIQIKILQKYQLSPLPFFIFPTAQAPPDCFNWLEIISVSQDPLGLLGALQRIRARTNICSPSNMQNLFSVLL